MKRRRGTAVRLSVALLLALVTVSLLAPLIAGDRAVLARDKGGFVRPGTPLEELTDATVIIPLIERSPDSIDLAARLLPPSSEHPLGTDDLGRDVLARLVHGGRISLLIGIGAALLALLVGSVVGAIAGYSGGWIDAVVMRVIEVVLCFPFLVVVLALIAVAGNSVHSIVLALGLTSWTTEARLVRGEMLRLRESEFAAAARATGAGGVRIALRHLLPNALPPAMVSATFGVAGAILTESALSFLGFGVPLPLSSWGSVLAAAEAHVGHAWWLAVFPGLVIFATVAACNVVGDALRRALNPRLTLRLQ